MTTREEEIRSIKYAHEFLRELINPKATPNVPSAIRSKALSVLRHYPYPYSIKEVLEELRKL